jgi:hypothetical protein
MKQNKTKIHTKPSTDWEAVRVLAIELGARESARRLGLKESTVLSRARRDKWKLPKRKGGATLKNATAITLQSPPGDVLIATHKELEGRTKSGLAQATARAAEAAAKSEKPIDVSSPSHLRDLAATAAHVFGWNKDGPQGNTYNTLCITAEQLEQIRQLREPTVYEAPQSETRPQPFPANSSPVDYELKVTL